MTLYPKSKLSPSVIWGEFGGERFGRAWKFFGSQWDERMIFIACRILWEKDSPLPAWGAESQHKINKNNNNINLPKLFTEPAIQ